MAEYKKLEGAALNASEKMKGKLFSVASDQLKLGKPGLIDRVLRPEDLGLSTPEWTFNIANSAAWNTMVDNAVVADNRFIGINGIMYPKSTDQSVSQIKITSMGKTLKYWQVQGVNYTENLTKYFDDPLIVMQNTPIKIEGYGVSTGATEKIIFLGRVVEKVGVLVQKGVMD